MSQLASLVVILAMVLGFLPVTLQSAQAAGSISLSAFDTAYTQNFDTLADRKSTRLNSSH